MYILFLIEKDIIENMEQENKVSNKHSFLAMALGALGMISCVVSIILAIVNSEVSEHFLMLALVLLGLNRIFLHLGKHHENVFYTFLVTSMMFVLGIFVSLTSVNIYFLIVSFFIYGALISLNRVFLIKKDRSLLSLILNILVIIFCLTYSFVFFFPAVYEKHATSVSNWNFIVLSYALIVFFTCFKSALIPVKGQLKLDRIIIKVRQELVLTIIMGLLVLVTLCSIYFLLVEPTMTSFADSLWYSFAVITTIGFGDVSVSTTFGRILSVILGIYGLIVVALVTSIIVTLYNDLSKKKDDEKAKEEEMEDLTTETPLIEKEKKD